jgi:hypothetical protein
MHLVTSTPSTIQTKLPANVLSLRPIINLGVSLSCESVGGGFTTAERTHLSPPRGFMGAQRGRRQHHCSSSAFPLSNSVGVSGKAQDFCNRGRLWTPDGDVRMGVMGSFSLNSGSFIFQ